MDAQRTSGRSFVGKPSPGHADERVQTAVGRLLVALGLGEAGALVDRDCAAVERGDAQLKALRAELRRRPSQSGLEERQAAPGTGEVGPQARADVGDALVDA